MKNKLFKLLLAAITAASVMTSALPAAAEADFGARDKNGVPIALETEPLFITNLSGRYDLNGGICYFVEKSMKLERDITLPENSMLVVRNGANLKIGAGVKLTINGTLAVHTGAKINPLNGGSLIMGENSVSVINGTLAVSRGGSALIGGYAQCERVNVKGSIKTTGSAELFYRQKKIYPGAKITGSMTKADGSARYMVWELDNADGDLYLFDAQCGESATEKDFKTKRDIILSFESVLYKYNGEIQLPADITAPEFMKEIDYDVVWCETETKDGTLRFGTTSWRGAAFVDSTDNESELEGSFYSIVKGNPDEQLIENIVSGNNHPPGSTWIAKSV